MSLGVSSLRVSVPQCAGCVPRILWKVCPNVVGVSLYSRVYPSVGGCVPVWEDVSQCGRVCLTVGKCVPVW